MLAVLTELKTPVCDNSGPILGGFGGGGGVVAFQVKEMNAIADSAAAYTRPPLSST